jgi:hypothetical protein
MRSARVLGSTCAAVLLALAPVRSAAQLGEPEPAGVLAAIRAHLSARATGALAIDPRPLRAGFQPVGGLAPDDLLDDPEIIAARTRFAHANGLLVSDMLVDEVCVFSAGVGAPPGAVLSPEQLVRARMCSERGSFTTFAVGIINPAGSGSFSRVEARVLVFTSSGIFVWDYTLVPRGDGAWRVERVKRAFGIMS